MARYLIDRPIFAWVIAIVLMLAGALALRSLPIAQFPNIAPPAIAINTISPGADAQTLANTTTQVIEQQLKGLDHLRYFSSTSDRSAEHTSELQSIMLTSYAVFYMTNKNNTQQQTLTTRTP